jgi:hypothetical protein
MRSLGRSNPRDWDVFVSHASEDKDAVAGPLVEALVAAGLQVWYDRIELRIGDSLREKIDEGLAYSRFGIVILSPSFFAKHWPKQELNGLAQREVSGEKVILPVWYDINADEVRRHSPILADRVAARWSDGLDAVVAQVLNIVRDDDNALGNASEGNPARPVPEPTPAPSTSTDYSSLVLITTREGKNLFVHSKNVESADILKLDLVPGNPRERAFLAAFQNEWRRQIYAAYDLTAIAGRIGSISHARTGGKEHWSWTARWLAASSRARE